MSINYKKQCPGVITTGGVITKEYSFFKIDKRNREIEEKGIKGLEDSFKEYIENDQIYPFQVAITIYWELGMEQGIIQQGRHRYNICKEQGREIAYTTTHRNISPNEFQSSGNQEYKIGQAIKSIAEDGNESYMVLHKLSEKYCKYSMGALTTFLTGKIWANKSLTDRNFFIKINLEEARERAEYRIEKYEEFLVHAKRKDKSKELIKLFIEVLDNMKIGEWEYHMTRVSLNKEDIEVESVSSNIQAIALIKRLFNTNSERPVLVRNEKGGQA